MCALCGRTVTIVHLGSWLLQLLMIWCNDRARLSLLQNIQSIIIKQNMLIALLCQCSKGSIQTPQGWCCQLWFTFMYFELFNTLMYADYGSVRLIGMSPRNRKYRVAMDTMSTAVLWWETTFNKPLFIYLFIYNTYQEMSEICVICICVLNSSLLILGLKKEERKKKKQSRGIRVNIVNENVLHNENKLHLTLVKN